MIACISTPGVGIACEQSRRKEIFGKPIVLTDSKGLVAAASRSAQSTGIRRGQSLSAAATLCPVSCPYDAAAYEPTAARIWNIIARESSFVEPISPEQCCVRLDPSLAMAQARLLMRQIIPIAEWPVLIGLGRTKLIACQAAKSTKHGQPRCISAAEEILFLGAIPLSDLAVDAKLLQRLQKLGITRLRDVAAIDPNLLPRSLKEPMHALRRLAEGCDDDPVRPLWPKRVIRESFTFDEPANLMEQVESAVGLVAGRIGDALRSDRQYCRIIALSIELDHGKKYRQMEKLASPSSGGQDLERAALRVLQRIYETHIKNSKANFSVLALLLRVTGIDPATGIQQTLLDIYGNSLLEERERALESTVDYAKNRWGAGAIVNGSQLLHVTQRSLYTGSLGHRPRHDSIDVEANQDGEPVCYTLGDRSDRILQIVDRWREHRWDSLPGGQGRGEVNPVPERHNGPRSRSASSEDSDTSADLTIYQAQTPHGLVELARHGDKWRLRAIAD